MSGTVTASGNGVFNRIAKKQEGEEVEIRKVEFEYTGTKIILPADMTLDEAEEAIHRQAEEENVKVTFSEKINAFPLDGAVALMRVLKKRYGWTHLVPTPGFWGPTPPAMIGVETAVGERVQVPWGDMMVPKVDGVIKTSVGFDNGQPYFQLSGTVKRKHERIIAAIANDIREEVKSGSIYRFKAIKINFRDSAGERVEYDNSLAPRFIDLATVGDCKPIFSKEIADAIRVNIHNPIRYSKRCRTKGASLKRGVMLGGPFGTGKTLEAFETAKICMENDWTFLMLEDVRDLDLAIGFAKLYQPCVLFAEDCDKAAQGGRTPEMDRLLNTIDGVESKGDQSLIIVLTTNNLDAINRAFLRPGRIDAIINVLPPDDQACLQIVKKYVGEGDCVMEGSDKDFIAAIQPLVGANAAFFRNVVDQAKLSAIGNMESDDSVVTIRPNDLAIVAKGMVPHAVLLNPEHGIKRLQDMSEEQLDPLTVGFEIIMQKAAEAFVSQLANPKTLEKIIFKANGGGRRRGGSPSSN